MRIDRRDYRPLHLSVPVLSFGTRGSEDFEMPFAAAPWLDDLGGHDIHKDFGKGPAFGIAFEVIGGLVPRERGIEHHRQEEVVAVVHDDQLSAGALHGRMVNEIFFRAVGADVALEREFPSDDLFDCDLLVPAVAAIAFFTARLGHFLGAAQGTASLDDCFPGHGNNCTTPSANQTFCGSRGRSAGPYISSAYCFTMRRALKRGVTETIACRTKASHRRGIPCASRS